MNNSFDRSLVRALGLSALIALSAVACSKSSPPSEPPPATAEQAVESAGAADEGNPAASAEAAPSAADPAAPAAVGQPAPDFTLKSLDGNEYSLSQLKGKTVVLEWFNPDCPFVRNSHTQGSLKGLAAKHRDAGVQWLAINSGAPGKQGASVESIKAGIEKYNIDYPVLIDDTGRVGKQYGAERTPHMYVIDPEGVLVYRGAIDNSPDGEGKSPEGGKLVNYVEQALLAVRQGAKVETAETKAYGCGVKYAD